jgi:hypothetical protein
MDKHLVERQRRLFEITEEFFWTATGENVESFSKRGPFAEVVRSRADVLGRRGINAFSNFEERIRPYYAETWQNAFRDARNAAGMKLVLGGTSRFLGEQLSAVRKMALYSDTILIPDPLLPWFETERPEEKFRHMNLLQSAFWLLHLKPLVDRDLPYPAILVFPSWEKGLEAKDPTTRERQLGLVAAVVGNCTGRSFGDFTEVVAFATNSPAEFLRVIDQAQLFIAPGANEPEPIDIGIVRYRDHLATWRTDSHTAELLSLPHSLLVVNALLERLGPQYHLLENADELAAQPMMANLVHWHYHKLVARTFEGRLSTRGMLSAKTVAILRALDEPSNEWLGNVPIASLAELRSNNENEAFRKRMAEYTDTLHAADIDDLDRVAAEVGRGIAALIVDHKKEVRRIAEDHQLAYSATLAGGVVTLAAMYAPALAPFVDGLHAPLALAGAYAHTKQKELLERRRAARSLTGVLAAANK